MRNIKKSFAWAISYSVILFVFTLYVVLDTFVIPRAYVQLDTQETQSETLVSTATDISSSTAGTSSDTDDGSEVEDDGYSDLFTDEAVITDTSYSDENINITITEYRENNTTIYVADIYLSSIEYLSTAFAQNTYGRNVTQQTSAIASAQDAILAINGDFYGARTSGYVIRNGILFRETVSDSAQEDLVIYSDGSFDIITEGSVTAQELLDSGALQVLSFGPGLIDDGEILVTSRDEVDKAMTSNPRTAIGIIDDLHYVMVVSDGRTSESTGLTLLELATFMEDLWVTTAYNLDGGGSSTMYFNGVVVNNPTTNGKKISERSVSDIVLIGE